MILLILSSRGIMYSFRPHEIFRDSSSILLFISKYMNVCLEAHSMPHRGMAATITACLSRERPQASAGVFEKSK